MNTIINSIRALLDRIVTVRDTGPALSRVNQLVVELEAEAKAALDRSDALLELSAQVATKASAEGSYGRQIGALAGRLNDAVKA